MGSGFLLATGDETGAGHSHPYSRHVNPELARILASLDLDKRYVRGEGSWLEDERGERYLDFAAGYGALPFGHAPGAVWDAVVAARDAGEPILAQPSLLEAAGELTAALVPLAPVGLDRVCFANSGAEAIEVAVKIAKSATGRGGVLSTDDGFHGKTLGALSATGRREYQEEFGAPVAGYERIPFGDARALEEKLRAAPDRYACFVVEPIQAEGGVHVPPPAYLPEVQRICRDHGVLVVLDEVQTGLGRTGKMFACEGSATPDVLALGKALGGGILPSAAVLYRAALATEAFALRHTSTFAGNGLAMRVGKKVLQMLTAEDLELVRHVSEQGENLLASLRSLRDSHPGLIRDVRGRGLLLGIELTSEVGAFGRQCLLGSLAAQGTLAPAFCSHLLNVERIRLAPTVLSGSVLRVEPPLTVTPAECEQFLASLRRALDVFASGDSSRALSHLWRPGKPISAGPPAREAAPEARPPLRPRRAEPRFAFLVHPLDPGGLRDFDVSLEGLTDAEFAQLGDRLRRGRSSLAPAALPIGAGRVESETGETAVGEIFGIPYTAAMLLELSAPEAARLVGEAVEVARDRGAEVVGLGAYTSIITANATALGDPGVAVTTGNGFTISAAVEAVREAMAEQGVEPAGARVGVLGASGAIGKAASRLLAREAGSLVLIGNPLRPAISQKRLQAAAVQLVRALRDSCPGAPLLQGAGGDDHAAVERLRESRVLELTVDVDAALGSLDVLVTATSTPEPLVAGAALRPGAIVCDIAQPPNIAPAVRDLRPDVVLFEGGVVQLPGGRPFGVDYGLPPGLTYACMAETMILALDREQRLRSFGDNLSDADVLELGRRAHRHGFKLPVVPPERQGASVAR